MSRKFGLLKLAIACCFWIVIIRAALTYRACIFAMHLFAGVAKLVDAPDSKFSSDFVSQVKIKLFCGVPVKGFAGSIKKDCRQTINVFSARVVKLVDTGDKRKPVSLKN